MRHNDRRIAEGRIVATAFDEVMGVRRAFAGLAPPAADEVTITGADPVFSTTFRIGESCAAVLGGVGVAVCDIWQMKTGRRQRVSIDVRHASAGLRSSLYLQRPGADGVFRPVVNKHHEEMRAITQTWSTRAGRWGRRNFGLQKIKERVHTQL